MTEGGEEVGEKHMEEREGGKAEIKEYETSTNPPPFSLDGLDVFGARVQLDWTGDDL